MRINPKLLLIPLLELSFRRGVKNREGKAQKESRPDAYYKYARGWILCSNAASAGFSRLA